MIHVGRMGFERWWVWCEGVGDDDDLIWRVHKLIVYSIISFSPLLSLFALSSFLFTLCSFLFPLSSFLVALYACSRILSHRYIGQLQLPLTSYLCITYHPSSLKIDSNQLKSTQTDSNRLKPTSNGSNHLKPNSNPTQILKFLPLGPIVSYTHAHLSGYGFIIIIDHHHQYITSFCWTSDVGRVLVNWMTHNDDLDAWTISTPWQLAMTTIYSNITTPGQPRQPRRLDNSDTSAVLR